MENGDPPRTPKLGNTDGTPILYQNAGTCQATSQLRILSRREILALLGAGRTALLVGMASILNT